MLWSITAGSASGQVHKNMHRGLNWDWSPSIELLSSDWSFCWNLLSAGLQAGKWTEISGRLSALCVSCTNCQNPAWNKVQRAMEAESRVGSSVCEVEFTPPNTQISESNHSRCTRSCPYPVNISESCCWTNMVYIPVSLMVTFFNSKDPSGFIVTGPYAGPLTWYLEVPVRNAIIQFLSRPFLLNHRRRVALGGL